MDRGITQEMLCAYERSFEQDPINELRLHAVVKSGLNGTAANHLADVENPMEFSVEIETGKVTNQQQSGRCWLFAGLNTMRFEVMQKCNLETFELSQNHLMFWDKLEKANYFLESIIATASEPTDSRLVAHLLAAPVQDGGQWDMFCSLVDKYGVVPKGKMPETFHSANTPVMNKVLTAKLREDALALRTAVSEGQGPEALADRKQAMLQEVYRILCICLGEPPKRFTWEYRDKEKQFHRVEDITPQEFYRQFVGQALEDYVPVINAPTADKPYGKTYTVAYLGNVVGGKQVKYLNLPSEELKRLTIAQLQDGKPVWFGSDVGQQMARETGTMALDTFKYEQLLGIRLGMNKAQRLDYGESLLTHAMVFLGVNLVDGKPNRWKVENSWSDKNGQEGYFVMSDEWFDEFNYQVVIHKKYMTPEQVAAYEQPPIVLEPWDPMGSLA